MPAAYEVTVIIFKYILLSLFKKKKNNPQRQVKEKILKTSFLLLFSC